MNNINTKSYWDKRFKSGDWEAKSGRNQTKQFAVTQIKHFELNREFKGTILDFGCGMGDAFPIYRKAYPNAELIGLDFSNEAIKRCHETYSHLGKFICGDYSVVPSVDIIIASNVFEHLTNDLEIAKELLKRCKCLFVIVPYKEEKHYNPFHEHINSYDEESFNQLTNSCSWKIFKSKGWGEGGLKLYYSIYLKNMARLLLGRKTQKVGKQIMYKLVKGR